MTVQPLVRYMLLCDDWLLDPQKNRRITVIGLLSNVHSLEDPPYPLLYEELCVLLLLTGGRGQGQAKVACVFEDGDERTPVFETRERALAFGPDPLEILGVPFRIRDCTFPHAGLYFVQFWYEGQLIEERPLRMR